MSPFLNLDAEPRTPLREEALAVLTGAQGLMVILTTCPSPIGGGPKPTFETYRFPSGPNVMAVGKDSPVAISAYVWFSSIRKTFPVPGVGNGFPVVFSST